ncbi:MAG: hypothetical protein JWO03_2765 [Bacteroidetes bacterium]|nr:hypothetical protein [Bacteroidota bacterium]
MNAAGIKDDITIGQALADFFQQNDLGENGGADARWVKLKLGRFYIPFPNTPGRKEAVKYHDIHHIVAGYPTTWSGEAAIGAWEISTGCGDYRAAWIFDLGVFALGLFIFPRTIFRAFIRGRRSLNFFHHTYPYEQILEMKISDARVKLNLHKADHKDPDAPEVIEFVLWWLIAYIVSMVVFVAPVAIPIIILVG